MISQTEGLAAVIATAIREAVVTARFAAPDDFQLPARYPDETRRAVRTGAELAAASIAAALELRPGTAARRAFMTACGVSNPANQ